MFTYSLDSKKEITDNKGNRIIDLTTSIFAKRSADIDSFFVRHMTSRYVMRPDLVSLYEYGTTDQTEYILKYSGISNPFTLAEGDYLRIPNEDEAINSMAVNNTRDLTGDSIAMNQVRNYYKFVNQDYKSDSTSYDKLKDMKINSAVLDPTEDGDYTVPYISEDGTTAVTVRNGRMYFGEDNGMPTASVIKASTTSLDEKL